MARHDLTKSINRALCCLSGVLVGFCVAILALGPHAFAADGTSGMCGNASIDCETGQTFDSQDPPHTICINGTCQTATGHGTATFTVTATGTASATNTLYSAGGLILLASVHDTATGTGTGSATETASSTKTASLSQTTTATHFGTQTTTFLATTTDSTTETLTQTLVAQLTYSRTATTTATLSASDTFTGTGTATGTNTGTGTISGTGTASANSTATSSESGTGYGVRTATWSNTTTHDSTGTKTITVTYAATNTAAIAGPATVTSTGTLTVTGSGTGTWTNTTTHTSTGTSALISDNPTVSDTKVNTHVVVTPKATATVTETITLTQTDFCATSPEGGGIPCAGTNSKIDIGWLPTGTSTNSVITGADPRLTDARASTNVVYQGTTNVSFSTGTSTATATSAAVADNPKIHVAVSSAVATQTLSAPGGTSTWSGTLTMTQTQIATTGTGTGIIPMTGTNSKINQAVVPWGAIASDVLPSSDDTYYLGSAGASKRWKGLDVSGTVSAGAFSGPGIFVNWQHVETTGATASTHSWTEVASYSYLYWPDSKIVVSGSFTAQTNTSTSGGCCARIVLDSTVIGTTICASAVTVGNIIALSSNGAADVAAGSHAVTLQVYDSGDTDCIVPVGNGGLTVSIFSD